jgi:hypothetical protein
VELAKETICYNDKDVQKNRRFRWYCMFHVEVNNLTANNTSIWGVQKPTRELKICFRLLLYHSSLREQ